MVMGFSRCGISAERAADRKGSSEVFFGIEGKFYHPFITGNLLVDLKHIRTRRDRKAKKRIVQVRAECKINQIDAGFIAVKV